MTAVVAPEPTRAYPVRLTATPEPDGPSRGLWLVKWLLVIPHAIVLAFLWLAFGVLTVVAFVAILVTGRYPRAIFDFTVGVLRWSWRVSYYAYGNLGTDRYPPFSLRSDPDYPADLHVEYPERLSRGLVLVKSWLLAIPHYLILGALTNTGAVQAVDADGTWVWRAPGLFAVLAVIAGVALLFTGRLPQGLYDLLLGLNRWALRVTGYAALMTDAYPPFRLDQGGPDGPAAPPPPTPAGSRWTAGPVLSVIAGAVALAVGLGMATGAAAMLAAREDGFVTTPTMSVETEGYAVVTDVLRLEGVGLDEGLGQVRLRAEADDGREIFLGIGADDDVRAYLAGVERSVVRGPWLPERSLPGGPPASAPEDATWLASSSGPGRQELVLEPQEGSWLIVVMPTDLSTGLAAEVDAGAEFPWLEPAAGVLLALGLGLLLVGAGVIALGVRAASVRAAG
ncbi:DUF4389 domain-containing protein [Nostocoides sp. F2B08]|uniref:DUF4389 domain-containing protein n=1 Tax=Nostocoides sp. F2B08 TaxID=2653936 RepID=UPI0012632633|nr:DUF4389 domain-containing protein [Tetrasphaera sp. F2B08]